jgi:hypothetical protein
MAQPPISKVETGERYPDVVERAWPSPIVVRGKLLKSGVIFLLLIQELLTPEFIGLEA